MLIGIVAIIALACIGGVMSGMPLWFAIALFLAFLLTITGMVRSQ